MITALIITSDRAKVAALLPFVSRTSKLGASFVVERDGNGQPLTRTTAREVAGGYVMLLAAHDIACGYLIRSNGQVIEHYIPDSPPCVEAA